MKNTPEDLSTHESFLEVSYHEQKSQDEYLAHVSRGDQNINSCKQKPATHTNMVSSKDIRDHSPCEFCS
mgnify:CR=1 FL=1